MWMDALEAILDPATAAFALAAIGLNFHFGMTGLLNMGHAGFLLIGAYGYAIPTSNGAPIWVALLISMVSAVIFAILLGWPTLKLRGDYLAIVTIAAAEMIRFLGRSQSLESLTGGSTGIRGNDFKGSFQDLSPFPDEVVTVGPFAYPGTASASWWLRVVAWAVVALGALIFWRLSKSPWGRVLKGIREDEDAVRSLGKDVYFYKMQALVIGGVFGALGGVIWALGSSVQPDSMGRPVTFQIWTIVLLGGAASVFGPILGSALYFASLVIVKGTIDFILPEAWLTPTQQAPLSLAIMGVVLMLLVIFRPQGIMGDKREVAING